MKNKKGFTLIELLAVIVVLAIIMVIATTSITSAMNNAKKESFVDSYKAIVKEVKNRITMNSNLISDDLGLASKTIECDDNDTDQNKHCSKIYDISEKDYKMKVEKNGNDYNLTLIGQGKFSNINLSSSDISNAQVVGNKVVNAISSQGKEIELSEEQVRQMTIDNKIKEMNEYMTFLLANNSIKSNDDDGTILKYTHTVMCNSGYTPVGISFKDGKYSNENGDFILDNISSTEFNSNWCYTTYYSGGYKAANVIYTCLDSDSNINLTNGVNISTNPNAILKCNTNSQ